MPFFTLPSRGHRILLDKKELVASFAKWFEGIATLVRDNVMRERLNAKKELLIKKLASFRMMGWNKLSVTKQFSLETRVLGDWIHQGLTADNIIKARIGFCEGLNTHIGILSNGDMVFCCADFDGKTSFGNIKDTSIRKALAQKRVQDVIDGFRKLLIKEPYCQRCLGDVSFEKSIMRQIGSILYFKLYRPWWNRKREREDVLL